ncbi:MAG: hypothetical protein WCK63_12120 [Betaproteobacteria bacterium]
MKRKPAEKYIEKAKLLTNEELAKVFARMRIDLHIRMDSRKVSSFEAAAVQLEIEADQVNEWRMKWARPPLSVEKAENIST